MTLRRCAIYTRKSTEEGLEQDFNSLDAQREACAAFILSQRHEGWRERPERYDDGGFSGGSMERPALQRLLEDVRAGQVDVVVVYKVDRLTRSLSDFARIVETFDGAGVSFVSVTQAFNTTTSMGRLTLNVLLSFAQFEREVTAERIRDKIAASKRKGMWMGGPPPLGYDVHDKALVVNTAEAKAVRTIFERYRDLGSVRELRTELDRLGLRSKRRVNRHGHATGGARFSRGALYSILRNRLYLGEIAYRGAVHPGKHEAILDRDLWEAVQRILAGNGGRPITGMRRPARENRLLAGLLFDGHGRPMRPTNAVRAVHSGGATVKKRYWYYVSQSSGPDDGHPVARLPAEQIERMVIDTLVARLGDASAVLDLLAAQRCRPRDAGTTVGRARNLALRIVEGRGTDAPASMHALLMALLVRIDVSRTQLTLALNPEPLYGAVPDDSEVRPALPLTVPLQVSQAGRARPIVLHGDGPAPRRDPDLIALVADARRWAAELQAGEAKTVAEITRREGRAKGAVSRILPLAWLAPDIAAAVLNGRQPAALTARRLRTLHDLPADWQAQRDLLGF